MKYTALALTLLMALTISACKPQATQNQAETAPSTTNSEETNTENDNEMMEEEEESSEQMENNREEQETEESEEDSTADEEEETQAAAFEYADYSAERRTELNGKTAYVINFHADWCPVCQALDKKIKASMDQLPEGTVMLKANFDEETELKKEFGITQQTTLVFFDAQGNKIAQEYNPDINEIRDYLLQ